MLVVGGDRMKQYGRDRGLTCEGKARLQEVWWWCNEDEVGCYVWAEDE